MNQVAKQVMVEKSVDDVMQALVKCVADVKAAAKAGGSAAVEGTAIATSLVSDLFPVMGELAQVLPDAKADPVGAEKAVLVAMPDLLAAIKG